MSVYPSRALKVPNQPLWLCLGLAFTNFFCLLLILMALSNLADRVSDVERTMNTTSTMLEVADTKITKTTLYQSTLYGMMKETREAVENEAKKLAGKIEGLTELSREYNSMLLEELKKGKTVTVFKHEDIDYLRVLMKENREAVENEGKKLAGKIEGLTGLSREHNSMLLEELKKGNTVTVMKHEDVDYLRVLVADLERKRPLQIIMKTTLYQMMKENREAVENEGKKLTQKVEGLGLIAIALALLLVVWLVVSKAMSLT